MHELEAIVREHAARYPLMQPQDAVKLLYQNEFGAAHMIANEAICRAALCTEYGATVHDATSLRCENIGNGMARIHLAAIAADELDALATAFIDGANHQRGNNEHFQEKLMLLVALAQDDLFAFSPEELAAYLTAYEAAGFPAVSHSEIYRTAYHPAYRVVPLE